MLDPDDFPDDWADKLPIHLDAKLIITAILMLIGAAAFIYILTYVEQPAG